jgi:GNAT superfamily N-acetyltransferase
MRGPSAVTGSNPSCAAGSADAPTLRRARAQDLPEIVRLLAEDPLGARRERYELPLPASYEAAFAAIDRDPNQELCVACLDDAVIGVLQLTFIPYLTYQGGWRALIEGVRIAPGLRSRGLGRVLFEWAIERARARGCHMVQLTSDKTRPDAIRFYQALGFVASHEGMKLLLEPVPPAKADPHTG